MLLMGPGYIEVYNNFPSVSSVEDPFLGTHQEKQENNQRIRIPLE